MLPLYRDTTRVALVEEQFYIAKFPLPHHKKLKPQIIIRIIKASVLPGRYQEKECSCFDFLAHSMFTFDVFCGSLCTSIFGNSSLAANKTWSRMHSRLYFRFLWLWFKFVVMNSVVIFLCLLFYFSMTRQFFFCLFFCFVFCKRKPVFRNYQIQQAKQKNYRTADAYGNVHTHVLFKGIHYIEIVWKNQLKYWK